MASGRREILLPCRIRSLGPLQAHPKAGGGEIGLRRALGKGILEAAFVAETGGEPDGKSGVGVCTQGFGPCRVGQEVRHRVILKADARDSLYGLPVGIGHNIIGEGKLVSVFVVVGHIGKVRPHIVGLEVGLFTGVEEVGRYVKVHPGREFKGVAEEEAVLVGSILVCPAVPLVLYGNVEAVLFRTAGEGDRVVH